MASGKFYIKKLKYGLIDSRKLNDDLLSDNVKAKLVPDTTQTGLFLTKRQNGLKWEKPIEGAHNGTYWTSLTFGNVSKNIPAAVGGTHDGTNWTTLTIGNDTKNIPSGGSSATLYQHNFKIEYQGSIYIFSLINSISTSMASGAALYNWFVLKGISSLPITCGGSLYLDLEEEDPVARPVMYAEFTNDSAQSNPAQVRLKVHSFVNSWSAGNEYIDTFTLDTESEAEWDSITDTFYAIN